ncbi:MAG: nucleotide exchange factor GrpE [candidate division WOR-3 bacterium]
MKAELEKMTSDANRLKDAYLQSLAEFDNFRRRKEREMQELRELANETLLSALIPVLDNLERALCAAEELGKAGQVQDCERSFYRGVTLIARQLWDTLGKHGLKQYSCLGEAFDPRRCEAVGWVETDDCPEGTVVAESAKGYMCYARVLRPAMVTVARPKPASCKTSESVKPTIEEGNETAE